MTTTKTFQTTLDLRSSRADHFAAGTAPELVTVEDSTYLTLRGRNSVNEAGCFTSLLDCRRTIYTVAVQIQSNARQSGHDFLLPPMEVLWWPFQGYGDESRDPWASSQGRWSWKAMLMMPDFVTPEMVALAAESCAARAGDNRIKLVALESLDEGLCVQVLHAGPYSSLWKSISGMRQVLRSKGLRCCGPQHEIYLRCEPHTADDDVRIVIRQPVRTARAFGLLRHAVGHQPR